jgi:protein TonB
MHVVHHPTPPQPTAPPPPAPKIGVSEDATAKDGLAVATGVTTDGTLGTGTSTDPTPEPPAPPAPPPPTPAPAPRGPHVFKAFEVTRMPKAIHPAAPVVPDAFKEQAQREAVVVIEVVIDARGNVVDARVLRHADFGLDDAALAAARTTTFEPALVGTDAVAVRYQIPYRFKVRG